MKVSNELSLNRLIRNASSLVQTKEAYALSCKTNFIQKLTLPAQHFLFDRCFCTIFPLIEAEMNVKQSTTT